MNDFSTTEHLIAKLGIKKRCEHQDVTLVQHVDEDVGWFACWQCDRCGQITQHPVTADDLGIANDAPFLDVPMYEQVTTERAAHETASKTLAFFGQAAR